MFLGFVRAACQIIQRDAKMVGQGTEIVESRFLFACFVSLELPQGHPNGPAGGGLHPAPGNEKLPVEPARHAGLVPGGWLPVLYRRRRAESPASQDHAQGHEQQEQISDVLGGVNGQYGSSLFGNC